MKVINEAVQLDLNGDPYDWEKAISYIYKEYGDEFDYRSEVRDLSDYMQELYDQGGKIALDKEFFLPSADAAYKKDFYKLVRS